jgi:hypothetical protein
MVSADAIYNYVGLIDVIIKYGYGRTTTQTVVWITIVPFTIGDKESLGFDLFFITICILLE